MSRLSKNYSAREKQEGRCFIAEFYPENDGQEGYAYDVPGRMQYWWTKFYYILHDKDTYSETDYDRFFSDNNRAPTWKIGDLKKPHYHLIGYSDSPLLLGRAATKFGVPSNYVQKVTNTKKAIQYLIHLNNPEKYQYQKEEVITNDPKISTILKREVPSEEKAALLCQAVLESEICSMKNLCLFAIKNSCWDELRRSQHIFSQLLEEKRRYTKTVELEESYYGWKELNLDDINIDVSKILKQNEEVPFI